MFSVWHGVTASRSFVPRHTLPASASSTLKAQLPSVEHRARTLRICCGKGRLFRRFRLFYQELTVRGVFQIPRCRGIAGPLPGVPQDSHDGPMRTSDFFFAAMTGYRLNKQARAKLCAVDSNATQVLARLRLRPTSHKAAAGLTSRRQWQMHLAVTHYAIQAITERKNLVLSGVGTSAASASSGTHRIRRSPRPLLEAPLSRGKGF